jgi:hypothetical protein
MKKHKLIIFIYLLVAGCDEKVDYYDFNGVFIECYDESNPFSYDLDNVIYTPGKTFIFDYRVYKKDDGLAYQFHDSARESTYPPDYWKLNQKSTGDNRMIAQLHMTVLKNKLQKLDQGDGAQSQISYQFMYVDSSFLTTKSRTGLVENPTNIWMHPVRYNNLAILQLTPFPFVKFPITLDEEYNWFLDIGQHYGSPLWAEWNGNIRNLCGYKVAEKKEIITAFGLLECYVIHARGDSPVGSSKAEFLFSEQYGFVQMNYICVNGDQIKFALVEVR